MALRDQIENYFIPDWPAPKNVRAISTLRGLSPADNLGGLNGFNLARHVQDEAVRVEQHRSFLQASLKLKRQPFWLNQTHSTRLLSLPSEEGLYDCDGSYTQSKDWPCVVMTADCLPILLCNLEGTQVAAVHAGWVGLAGGIVKKAVNKFDDPTKVLAWLGPAIGPDAFEVGEDVLHAFGVTGAAPSKEFAQVAGKPDKWLGNLYALARKELLALGVTSVFGGNYCTFSDPVNFYSHRRDAKSGRMASLIWIT